MLVLSRRVGETVKINGDITVTVVAVKGEKVRLGFTAPQQTPIHRSEVYEAIEESRRELAEVNGGG